MSHLKIPQFWHTESPNTRSRLLSYAFLPLSWIYRGFTRLNQAVTIQNQTAIPVICVGNVTVGGGGKTPTSRTILEIARTHEKFSSPCFLMRGYGGNYSGAVEVDPTRHTPWDVGDEALMQVQYAPVIVSRNRKLGADLAVKRGYDLIIMDDGFQNMGLKKDLSILVIDGGFGFGNRKCLPSGPLREPVSVAMKRAQAALIINRRNDIPLPELKDIRHFEAILSLVDHQDEQNNNRKIIAFAGIARPQKFFQTLEDNGYELHSRFGFADHHIYTHSQLNHMYQRAQKAGARLLTTEKDWVRLSSAWKQKIGHVRIIVQPDDSFVTYLTKAMDHMAR